MEKTPKHCITGEEQELFSWKILKRPGMRQKELFKTEKRGKKTVAAICLISRNEEEQVIFLWTPV